MEITAMDNQVVLFTGLTEAEWTAGRDWATNEIVNWEVWEDDHSKLAFSAPTSAQIDEVRDLMEAAG